ncbi:MAG TPA: hypothetical protein VFV89_01840 [Nocardioides sp.]|uniref:hypothetical protein n=1 Tax=Nocardioides sp. TaxID=35761 RepID=UPI002E30BF3B|nr:hypothetical protein [Nocardioides sp.]HEX5086516.1 hypothetical protein [Nocardioides sp.]
MTRTEASEPAVEKFAPNGGTVTAVVAGLVALAFILAWAIDIHRVALWVPALALLGGAIVWISTVRPRVRVQNHELVLQNMVTTTYLPLASIDEVAVRQVMAVRAGGQRYICSGVGRSMRSALKGSSVEQARQQVGGLRGELAKVPEPGMHYADFVELRVRELINEDRMRRGVKRYSPEADELAKQVRRVPSWPAIAILAVVAVFLVVSLVVG